MTMQIDSRSKAAATRLGLTDRQYLARVRSGLHWCGKCRRWMPASMFGADRSRTKYGGLAARCRACRLKGKRT